MTRRGKHQGSPLLSWVLLLIWVAVIWGHSLMSGQMSSLESGRVVEFVQKAAAWLSQNHNALFERLVSEHPRILEVLADSSLLGYYIRKGAHFTEYLILGMLSFNALRLTFRSPLTSLAVMGAVWVFVPNVDEMIQRFVPNRSGQMSDVLLDMAGFGTGFLLCLLLAAIAAFFGLLFRPRPAAYES